MRTPITYYGGKQRMADTIISMMPAHKLYCEPILRRRGCFLPETKSWNRSDQRSQQYVDKFLPGSAKQFS